MCFLLLLLGFVVVDIDKADNGRRDSYYITFQWLTFTSMQQNCVFSVFELSNNPQLTIFAIGLEN